MVPVEEQPRSAAIRLETLDPGSRIGALVWAASVVVVFAIAFMLHPDDRGHGTHQQLGLAPCMAMQVFGTPCPFCGMTTSFSYFAHGQPVNAMKTQPAGALLFVLSGISGVIGLGVAISGRWVADWGTERHIRRVVIVLAVAISLGWLYKIAVEWGVGTTPP